MTVVAIGEPMVPVLDGIWWKLRVHGSHCDRDLSHGAGYLSVMIPFEACAAKAAAHRPGHTAPVAAVITASSLDAAGSRQVALIQLVVIGVRLIIRPSAIRLNRWRSGSLGTPFNTIMFFIISSSVVAGKVFL